MSRVKLSLILILLSLGIFAYIRAGNFPGIINNEGYLIHTLQKIVEAKTLTHQPMNKKTQEKLERNLLTIDQMAYQAIIANTWEE